MDLTESTGKVKRGALLSEKWLLIVNFSNDDVDSESELK